MQSARVIGKAIATLKHPSLQAARLLIVQPLRVDGGPDGDPLIAVDSVSAGTGETVIITSDGQFARALLQSTANPVRWTIIGIQDNA